MMAESQGDLRVKQIMSRAIVSCPPQSSLREVAQLMYEAEVSSVVVVDKKGNMHGLISQFDLLKYYDEDLENYHVEACMVHDLVRIGMDERVAKAAQLMHEKKIHRLIVIELKENRRTGKVIERPMGVISVSDIIRHMGRFNLAT